MIDFDLFSLIRNWFAVHAVCDKFVEANFMDPFTRLQLSILRRVVQEDMVEFNLARDYISSWNKFNLSLTMSAYVAVAAYLVVTNRFDVRTAARRACHSMIFQMAVMLLQQAVLTVLVATAHVEHIYPLVHHVIGLCAFVCQVYMIVLHAFNSGIHWEDLDRRGNERHDVSMNRLERLETSLTGFDDRLAEVQTALEILMEDQLGKKRLATARIEN